MTQIGKVVSADNTRKINPDNNEPRQPHVSFKSIPDELILTFKQNKKLGNSIRFKFNIKDIRTQKRLLDENNFNRAYHNPNEMRELAKELRVLIKPEDSDSTIMKNIGEKMGLDKEFIESKLKLLKNNEEDIKNFETCLSKRREVFDKISEINSSFHNAFIKLGEGIQKDIIDLAKKHNVYIPNGTSILDYCKQIGEEMGADKEFVKNLLELQKKQIHISPKLAFNFIKK